MKEECLQETSDIRKYDMKDIFIELKKVEERRNSVVRNVNTIQRKHFHFSNNLHYINCRNINCKNLNQK